MNKRFVCILQTVDSELDIVYQGFEVQNKLKNNCRMVLLNIFVSLCLQLWSCFTAAVNLGSCRPLPPKSTGLKRAESQGLEFWKTFKPWQHCLWLTVEAVSPGMEALHLSDFLECIQNQRQEIQSLQSCNCSHQEIRELYFNGPTKLDKTSLFT